MKSFHLFSALSAVFIASAFPQENSSHIPPELNNMREDYLRDRQRALIPTLKNYILKLNSQKKLYEIQGNKAAEAIIEREISRTSDELSAANTAITSNERLQLVILSATYGDFKNKHLVDVMKAIRKSWTSGAKDVAINNDKIADGIDPAPGVSKELKLTYSINGRKKEKTFPENYNLNFDDDLL